MRENISKEFFVKFVSHLSCILGAKKRHVILRLAIERRICFSFFFCNSPCCIKGMKEQEIDSGTHLNSPNGQKSLWIEKCVKNVGVTYSRNKGN